MEKEKVIEAILCQLQRTSPTFEDNGHTLLQIREFLKLNNIKGYFEDGHGSWKNLKKLLEEMEEGGLVEERHFSEKYSGRVDYSIEQKGINLIKGKKLNLKFI